jgi:NAD(P)-dependent dehydrogenase (short-subunit alcohol dehydrogenase family)
MDMGGSTQRLAGRRIVLTGAASGMGAGIARLFAAEGARLLLLDVQAGPLAAIAAETGQPYGVCDVSDEAQVAEAIATAVATLGGIDGLLNVAGILVRASVAETDYAAFQRLLAINLGGPFLTCRAALPHLQASGKATIVNVSSLSGVRPQPGMAAYTATKAGLIGFSEALSGEVGPNVRVNVICPGVVKTPMTGFMWGDDDVVERDVGQRIGVGRVGTPDDVAQAALFLTSHDSAFVSAANLVVSGGHIR